MIWWLWLAAGGALFLLALMLSPFIIGRMFFPRLTLAMIRRTIGAIDKLADRIRPGLALELLVKAVNGYFGQKYAATPYSQRMLFLPFCLKAENCPAAVDRQQGMLCLSQCQGCTLGQMRQEAIDLGYGQVYVVPSSRILRHDNLMRSSEFMKAKLKEHKPAAVLGVICAWHLRNRILPKHTAGGKGYAPKGEASTGTVPQAVLMPLRNCFNATVDWPEVRRLIQLRQ